MRPRQPWAPSYQLLLLGLWLVAACGGQHLAFRDALARADHAARTDSAERASESYRRARDAARKPNERVETLYREALMWNDRAHVERAAQILARIGRDAPGSSRAARSWLDLGRIREKQGRLTAAAQAYRSVISKYPRSGLAERAAGALCRLSGGARSRAFGELLPGGSAELDSYLRFERARALEEEGQQARAISAFEELAKRYPLPAGRHTDEAMLRAARLRRAMGEPRGALAMLRVLLEVPRKAALIGSYERPAYAEARLLIAEITRDELNQPAAAERAFLQVVSEHPTSRWRAEALWQAAWLARSRGGSKEACQHASALLGLKPPSPLVQCLKLVCPEANPDGDSTSQRCQLALASTPRRLQLEPDTGQSRRNVEPISLRRP